MFTLNLLLALAWAAVTGELTAPNLLEGFVIGFAVLWLLHRPLGNTRYFSKAVNGSWFFLYFLWELLLATLRVAVDIVTPRHSMSPAVIAVPIGSESPVETTVLANVLSLTPGTLTLDVSPDGKVLYVHTMYAEDIEAARSSVQEGLGRQVRKVFQ